VIHADNARPHTPRKCTTLCAENGWRLAAHPLYSPDLALSGFCLFGHVNHSLHGTIFRLCDELLEAISEIVAAIPPETLHGVFEYWMERLELVYENSGDYNP
jgi:hypothetical protein